jgi:hypothetical protein
MGEGGREGAGVRPIPLCQCNESVEVQKGEEVPALV